MALAKSDLYLPIIQMPDYSELIDIEVDLLKRRFSELFAKGNYSFINGSLEEIKFSNDKNGTSLLFIYEHDRYSGGKHMFLAEIKFQKNSSVYSLGELVEKNHPDFDSKNYFNFQRNNNIPLRKAYVSLINNYLIDVKGFVSV